MDGFSCANQTTVGSTDWRQYGADGIYVDVDTSACVFATTPVYASGLGGDNSHWASRGSSELYELGAAGFRIYVSFTGITAAQANTWNWHINWVAHQATTTQLVQKAKGCSHGKAYTTDTTWQGTC